MVCEENDLGEFVKYEKSKNIIVCEHKPDLVEYDGGYIKIINKKS